MELTAGEPQGFLPKEIFENITDCTPLVSIDFIITDAEKILLGKRLNRPAKGDWFVPGGRVLKNETLDNAFQRLAVCEIGKPCFRHEADLVGVYEHFYPDSMFSSNISTHYIVLAYQLHLVPVELDLPKKEHDSFKWWPLIEAFHSFNVSFYTKKYIQDITKEYLK
ncbi:NUDIX domain-containing protein [Halomonas titanicae]|uniref:GDP-mannose mannosyl hydrolase n=1 Tax=Vreelandella titanicae TaxID=664683 RepID=UPI001F465384|nr:NUDIX domain-containing protein [Halomonas titanicae]MCE7520568.1 NUDIX domain-containing protein [Halomonas titanicae]